MTTMIVATTKNESKHRAAEALLRLVGENVQATANQAQYVVNCLYSCHLCNSHCFMYMISTLL